MAQPIQTEFTSHLIESVTLESEEMLRSLPNGGKGSSVTSGVSSQAGAFIPDVPSTGYASTYGDAPRSYAAILKGLSKLLPMTDANARDAKIASLHAEMNEESRDVKQEQLIANKAAKLSALEQKRQAIADIEHEAEQARAESAKAKKSALWGKISGLVTNLAMIAGGVALCLTGAGAVAGLGMVVGGVLGTVSSANGLAVASGKDGMGDKAENALMITSMVIGAVSFAGAAKSIAVSAQSAAVRYMPNATAQAGSVMSKAGAQAASLMPNSVAQAANMMSRAAAQAANMMSRAEAKLASFMPKVAEGGMTAERVMKAGALAEITATSTEVVANANTSGFQIAASKHEHNAQYARAASKQIEANMLTTDDIFDILLDNLSKENERFNSMLAEVMVSINDRGNTLAKVKFSG